MINLKVLKCFVETLSSYKMNSDRNINFKLGDVATALSDIVSSLRTATGTTSSVGELDRATDAVRSLQSDAGMAASVSQLFNRPSAAGNSLSRPMLLSVSRRQAPSHRFKP